MENFSIFVLYDYGASDKIILHENVICLFFQAETKVDFGVDIRFLRF